MYSDEADFTPPGGMMEWIRSNFLLVALVAFVLVTCGMCGLIFYTASSGSFSEQFYESCVTDNLDPDCNTFVENMQSAYRSMSLLACAGGLCISAVIALSMTMWKVYFAK